MPRSAREKSRLAVGIVLLLPADLARRAVTLSRRLPDRSLRLGPTAQPHLTLAMACVDRAAIPHIVRELETLTAGAHAIAVNLTRTAAVPGADHDTAWYIAAPSRELRRWHRQTVALLERYRQPGPAPRDFARPPGAAIAPSAVRWVRRFAEDAAFARYRPHVTLGYGAAPSDPRLPLVFHARRLALCHLGNHCTCARVLAERRLARAADPGNSRKLGDA